MYETTLNSKSSLYKLLSNHISISISMPSHSSSIFSPTLVARTLDSRLMLRAEKPYAYSTPSMLSMSTKSLSDAEPLGERELERIDERGRDHPPALSEQPYDCPAEDERKDDCAKPTDTGELHASEVDERLTKLYPSGSRSRDAPWDGTVMGTAADRPDAYAGLSVRGGCGLSEPVDTPRTPGRSCVRPPVDRTA